MMGEERRETASDRVVVVDVDDGCRKSSTMIRKVRIKIKLPTTSCGDDDEDRIRKVAEADDEDKEYACLLCGKGFRSRKALGGHMRVHAHQHQRPNDAMSDMELEKDEDGDKDVTRCPICGRDFPSNKALFGHMRCHPERSWRGIQPPVYNTSSSSTVSEVNQPPADDDDDVNGDIADDEKLAVVDLEKDLLPFGWGAKAVRGRVAIITKSYSSSSVPLQSPAADGANVEPEDVDGVQSLILLSLGDNGRDTANYIMMNKKLKFHADHDHQSETIRGTKRNRDQSEVVMKQMHKVRKYSMVDNDFKLILQPQYSYSTAVATEAAANKSTEERYKCTTCNKCFSSHQALGGHKSSHNKLRNNHTSPTAIGRQSNVDQAGSRCPVDHGTNHPLHQCNNCFKVFPSGQALGGHKRLHCTTTTTTTLISAAPPNLPMTRLPVKSSIVITDQPLARAAVVSSRDNKSRVLKEFDLNEPPPVEEEDDNNNNTTAS